MIYQNEVERESPVIPVPIPFQSRPEVVARQLRNAILAGSLKPGDRFVERTLAMQFGICQPTVREALKELELQGFVRKTPAGHTHVTRFSAEDFRRMLEVRLELEQLAIGRAASNLTSGAAEQLEWCADAMETAAGRFDLVEFHQSDVQFHRLIWDAAGNEYLAGALERVAFALFAFALVQRNGDGGDDLRASAKQHRRILEGLKSGDPKTARQAFMGSITWFWREYHGVCVDC